jgi:hypothetical protein
MEESKTSIAEMQKILNVFRKDYISIHMYFLKHLNRYRNVRMDIPKWDDNKFVVDKRIIINEIPKGHFISKKFQIDSKMSEDKIKDTYTIMYDIVDVATNVVIRRGLCEFRSEVWNVYLDLMKMSYNHYNMTKFNNNAMKSIERNKEAFDKLSKM